MTPLLNGLVLAAGSSAAASIVAKVTVTTALGLMGTWLARRSRAAVRHAMLAAVFGVLLVLPVASLLAPTLPITVPVAAREDRTTLPLNGTTETIPRRQAKTGTGVVPSGPRPAGLSRFSLWVAAWFAGTMLTMLPMAMGLWQVRRLRRSGLPWLRGQSVVEGLARDAGIRRRVEVLLHESLPGPMTCGAIHPAIVLSADAEVWEGEDLKRAMVHELEHVRRGDRVSQCLARAVCAVYWFHPLVWMTWRQLTLEAERSCDDAVLERSEATAYADQLVVLARRLSLAAKPAHGGPPVPAMANRADLATRVGAVLNGGQRRGRAGTVAVGFACTAALVLVFGMSPLRVIAGEAPQSAVAPRQFDVVSVKLLDPDSGSNHSSEHPDPGRLRMTGSMHRFIVRAFGITDGQIGGEPAWFKSRLYAIDAVNSTPANDAERMVMLRGVLADRFQLKLRREERELPVYALEVAPGGPKFHELKPGEELRRDGSPPPGVFARSFNSIEDLMNTLNNVFGGRMSLDRPVVDRTHLTGQYQMLLETEVEVQNDGFGHRSSQFPNLFQDIQAELGLKLVSTRIKMPYFVVEKAAAPTEN